MVMLWTKLIDWLTGKLHLYFKSYCNSEIVSSVRATNWFNLMFGSCDFICTCPVALQEQPTLPIVDRIKMVYSIQLTLFNPDKQTGM